MFQIRAPVEDYPWVDGDIGFPGYGDWSQREPNSTGPFQLPLPVYCNSMTLHE